jgi:hypothetical protein
MEGTQRKEREVRQRPGPKPTPVEGHRRNRLMLNLTDEELAQLMSAADTESAAAFARSVVLAYLARRRPS